MTCSTAEIQKRFVFVNMKVSYKSIKVISRSKLFVFGVNENVVIVINTLRKVLVSPIVHVMGKYKTTSMAT